MDSKSQKTIKLFHDIQDAFPDIPIKCKRCRMSRRVRDMHLDRLVITVMCDAFDNNVSFLKFIYCPDCYKEIQHEYSNVNHRS